MVNDIRIHPVSGKADLKAFIHVPDALYADDPNWIQPLEVERMGVLTDKNPYFLRSEAQYFIATRGDHAVGRISAQVDQLALEYIDPRMGHIGFFECEDDTGTAKALFEAAEGWLKSKGMTKSRGPFSLSVNEECGLLVKGFDTPPMIMMGHALPYYEKLYKAAGYRKAKDMFAYFLNIRKGFDEKILRFVAMGQRNKSIEIRDADLKNYDAELKEFFSIFNDAWAGNWGFIPFTDEEARHAAKEMKPVVAAHRCRICSYKGKTVAFMITLPDTNDMIKDFKGKLYPFNIFKLLWRIKMKYPKRVRVPLMGVRRHLQGTMAGACMVFMMIETIRVEVYRRGGRVGELSWILEDNDAMNKILADIGCIKYKTYRVFDKVL
ncbi:MAG: N-acetyltransferase [Proteobacteria bacterium]|nr:N-acetyltransferase [Pseudomonadota bacterium]